MNLWLIIGRAIGHVVAAIARVSVVLVRRAVKTGFAAAAWIDAALFLRRRGAP